MAGFDVDKMFVDSKRALKEFALKHPDEHFYAFSIDANGLCLNSEEQFEKTLTLYQERPDSSYRDENNILAVKFNTGDWEYQGFFYLKEGFDRNLYDDHYNLP
jgi:hypothetical protein